MCSINMIIRLGSEKIPLLKTSNDRTKPVYSFIYMVNVFSILTVKYYSRWNSMYMYLSNHCLWTLRGWGRRCRNRWTGISFAMIMWQLDWHLPWKLMLLKHRPQWLMIRDRVMDGFIGSYCMGRCELWRWMYYRYNTVW